MRSSIVTVAVISLLIGGCRVHEQRPPTPDDTVRVAEPTPPREASSQPTTQPTPEEIDALHFTSLIVDTHVDTPQTMADNDFDLLERHDEAHLDIPRMREGGLDAAFFSIWVSPDDYRGEAAFYRSLALFNTVHDAARRSPDAVVVDTADELQQAWESGQTAFLFGVEGGHALGSDDLDTIISRLQTFRALGARYLTLTWSTDNPLGHSSTDDHPERGLTDLGRTAIAEMERLGIIIDVSHVSDQTFNDIMDIATRPILASHSSARALSDHPRNMSDEMIRRVADNGGAVCVNYFSYYLDADYADRRSQIYRENRDAYRDVRRQDLSYTARGPAYRAVAVSLVPDLAIPNISTIADHIMHIVEVGGPDVACLGSDFDGVSELPQGLDDVTTLNQLTAELSARGLADHHIVKVLGGNVLRVLRATEAAP